MENHYFDENDVYTGSASVNPGTLPPADALRTAPPRRDGYWPVRNQAGDGWELMEDHRGEEGWLHGQSAVITALGVLPEGWSASPPTDVPAMDASEKRAAQYRARADPYRDAALSYQAEAAAWRLLGDEEMALAAAAKMDEQLRRYLSAKEAVRSETTYSAECQNEEAAETASTGEGEKAATPESGAERYYLTRSGTYHAEGCAYTTAAGEWLAPAEIAARKKDARPCSRCEPPPLADSGT